MNKKSNNINVFLLCLMLFVSVFVITQQTKKEVNLRENLVTAQENLDNSVKNASKLLEYTPTEYSEDKMSGYVGDLLSTTTKETKAFIYDTNEQIYPKIDKSLNLKVLLLDTIEPNTNEQMNDFKKQVFNEIYSKKDDKNILIFYVEDIDYLDIYFENEDLKDVFEKTFENSNDYLEFIYESEIVPDMTHDSRIKKTVENLNTVLVTSKLGTNYEFKSQQVKNIESKQKSLSISLIVKMIVIIVILFILINNVFRVISHNKKVNILTEYINVTSNGFYKDKDLLAKLFYSHIKKIPYKQLKSEKISKSNETVIEVKQEYSEIMLDKLFKNNNLDSDKELRELTQELLLENENKFTYNDLNKFVSNFYSEIDFNNVRNETKLLEILNDTTYVQTFRENNLDFKEFLNEYSTLLIKDDISHFDYRDFEYVRYLDLPNLTKYLDLYLNK